MSLARIAVSAATFTLLSAVGATAKPIAVSTDTNLRKSAGTNGEVVTLISEGHYRRDRQVRQWLVRSLPERPGRLCDRPERRHGAVRRPPRRGPAVVEGEIVYEPPVFYGPPRGYVMEPPVYYGYGVWSVLWLRLGLQRLGTAW